MNGLVRFQLSAMMFVQYLIWGAWWVTLGTYLNASGFDSIIGAVYSTQGIAAIITPLFLGAIADRFFAAEKLMGVLHLLGGATLFYLSTITGSANLVFGVVLLYMCFYMPTLPLSNAVAMNAMTNTEQQFPAVRVLGTIGWIVAGLSTGLGPSVLASLGVIGHDAVVPLEATNIPIKIAASASILLGLFSFTLPHTPPRARGQKQNLLSITGLDLLGKVREPSFWIFIVCSLLIVIPLSFYYAYANTFLVESRASVVAFGTTFSPVTIQTLGQISEIFFMLLLPVFFVRLGIKWVLIVGMLAWSARYLLFAYGVNDLGPIMPMLLVGIALHGVCYDFFFVAGQIYVDNKFAADMRARAQSFLALVTLGIGQVIGSDLANSVYLAHTASATQHDWRQIWLVPAALAFGVVVLFVLLFKEKNASANAANARVVPQSP